ncbi:MAG TPA: ATP-binding cassette domain-containing protein, partial [Castellaniella sp.]|nr:ATP-binding cassette domain-containing protein [Castellaniella sp.]
MKPKSSRIFVILVVLALALAPLMFGGFTVSLLNEIGIGALVALGLVLLTGVGGATSFGQAAFVGIAAYASAWLTTAQGMSPWLGLPFALLLTGLSALAIGMLTLRLGGHFLALSTIAWGLSIPMLFGNIDALGRHTGLSGIPPVTLGQWSLIEPEAMYYLVWFMVALAFVFSRNLLDSRPGRAIRGLRGGSTLLASVGADAYRLRLALFVTAALYAGIAGWLYAHMSRFVSPSPFNVHASIEYLLMAVAGGLGNLAGALVGSGVVLVLKNALQDVLPMLGLRAGQYDAIVFAAIFIALLHFARGGVMGFVRRWQRRRKAGQGAVARAPQAPAQPLPGRSMPVKGSPVLSVQGALKRFGGLVAVNDVSFELNAGEILGLIGPNGAGKSTMFNLLTGTLPMSAGTVRFLGRDITGMRQRDIARLGLARTFQHVKLRPHMSLLDNVALGAHARTQPSILRAGLRLDREQER